MPMLWEARVITFKVGDFETVRSFYKAVLLLKVIEEEPGEYVIFDLENIKLGLERDSDILLPVDVRSWCSITIFVRSLNDILENLRRLNVDHDLHTEGKYQRLEIPDPEGRVITFVVSS